MSTVLTKPKKPRPPKEDPFRYGWRFVKETTPEGDVIERQVPLTEEDVLHPQEEDFIVNSGRHDRIATYLKTALQSPYVPREEILVLADQRIDWGSKYGWAHGPDIAVLGGVQGSFDEGEGTFYMAKMKATALLVIEVTSPTTRGNDCGHKLREYHQVGVAVYVIIDVPYNGEAGNIQVFGYQAGKTQFEGLSKDEKGRLWLDAVGLWLGVKGLEVYLDDAEGNRLPDYNELVRRNRQMARKVRELEAKLARRSNGKRRNHGTH